MKYMKSRTAKAVISIIIIVVVLAAAAALALLPEWPRMVTLKPTRAEDSDGTLPGVIIEKMDSGLEDVIMKTDPFGHITVDGWEDKVPQGSVVRKAVVNARWKTDADSGAGNIFVGYSVDGGETFTEMGPFNASETEQLTQMELKELAGMEWPGSEPGRVRARWRGEDLDYMLAARGYASFIMDVYL